MRTFDKIKQCICNDTFDYVSGSKKKFGNKIIYDNKYIKFINEFISYIKIGLTEINAKYVKHLFNEYRVSVLFEKESKFYIVIFSSYHLRYAICICNDINSFNNRDGLYYRAKCTKGNLDTCTTPEDIFKNCKLPEHAKFNIGDIVMLNKKGRETYGNSHYSYDNTDLDLNKLFKITNVIYESTRIVYSVDSVIEKLGTVFDSYAECNLRKIKGGV